MGAQLDERIVELQRLAQKSRRRNLQLVQHAGLGHIGGDLSATDILVTLYHAVLKLHPQQPDDPGRDRFILSKGHCTGALYTTLAEIGFIAPEELETYMQPLSRLNGHPNRLSLPVIEANTGALGHGLPVAVGCALAARLSHADWLTYVLTGDGELQEGSNWEAAMAAAHYGLDNLTLVIDRNQLQQGAATEHTLRLEPLAEKWRAFGWTVCEIDGHDYAALLQVLDRNNATGGKPRCIIAHTHKGQGVSFMRDTVAWHHRVPTRDETSVALLELQEECS